jgi:UDP-N-acetylmuramate-alanine ligase
MSQEKKKSRQQYQHRIATISRTEALESGRHKKQAFAILGRHGRYSQPNQIVICMIEKGRLT